MEWEVAPQRLVELYTYLRANSVTKSGPPRWTIILHQSVTATVCSVALRNAIYDWARLACARPEDESAGYITLSIHDCTQLAQREELILKSKNFIHLTLIPYRQALEKSKRVNTTGVGLTIVTQTLPTS